MVTRTRLPENVAKFVSMEISRQTRKKRREKGRALTKKERMQAIAIAFSKARKRFPKQRTKLTRRFNSIMRR